MFTDMTEVVPEGQKGLAKIEHFEVSKADAAFARIRSMAHPDEYVEEGRYVRLYIGSTLMMTDTVMERGSNARVVHRSVGNVLIAGLGVGLILVPILAKKEVKSVTVVEKYRDVIDLVEPPLLKVKGSKKLKVVEADIFEWKPEKGTKFDVIYFDIWPNICTDALPEMAKLHRKFSRFKVMGGWMDSWQRAKLQYQKSHERRMGW
jgi:spermidine synthase